jgi:soluble lytic murein transglycosylase-like protein
MICHTTPPLRNGSSGPGGVRGYKYMACLLGLLVAPAWAQSRQPVDDALAQQRTAAAAMQESLAKQRAAVQKQLGPAGTESFFVLPRAASLGGVTGTVAAPAGALVTAAAECDPLPAPEVDSLVGETAQREGLSADLLRSVMRQESAFRPCAVSSKGAMGLMQLMPSTAEQFGIEDPFDPVTNLDAGARFLKQLLSKYGGDVPKALGAYNAGPSKVDAAGGVPAIPETMDYVRQILGNLPFH